MPGARRYVLDLHARIDAQGLAERHLPRGAVDVVGHVQVHAVAPDARAGLDGADGAVVVAYGDGGQVLDLHRRGEGPVLGVDAAGLQSAEIAQCIDVVDAGRDQHATTRPRPGG